MSYSNLELRTDAYGWPASAQQISPCSCHCHLTGGCFSPSVPAPNRFAVAGISPFEERRSEFPPPPDRPVADSTDSAKPWPQVLVAFFLAFSAWGPLLSFGAFQHFYDDIYPNIRSGIAWIGTTQGFLTFAIGALSGPFTNRSHLRELMGAGTAFICFGFLLAGESRDFLGVFLSLGIFVGIGSGCLMVPGIAMIARWSTSATQFLSIGIATAGGAFGGTILPIIFNSASKSAGISWAYRTLAFTVFGSLLICFFLFREPAPSEGGAERIFDLSLLRDTTYILFNVFLCFCFAGLYIPFWFLVSYSEIELHVEATSALGLIPIMNAGSFFGRILSILIARYIGTSNTLVLFIIFSGIISLCWITVYTFTGALVLGIFHSFFSGGVISLLIPLFVELWSDSQNLGNRFGFSYVFGGFGILLGVPLADTLLLRFGYRSLQILSSVFIFFSFCSLRITLASYRKRNPVSPT